MTINTNRRILCLFNLSDVIAQPWLDAGYEVHSVDPQHGIDSAERHTNYGEHGENYCLHFKHACTAEEHFTRWQATPPCWQVQFDLVIAFPVCTDLAVSGAAHWKKKAEADPDFQRKAVKSALVATHYNAPYIIENPVGRLATMWRAPDIYLHPYEYGGWIDPNEAEHPQWPEYIAPMDAYPKKTGLWLGEGAQLPLRNPVEPEQGNSRQHLKLGGKSMKTKNIRSQTPRGLALGIFLANCEMTEFISWVSMNEHQYWNYITEYNVAEMNVINGSLS